MNIFLETIAFLFFVFGAIVVSIVLTILAVCLGWFLGGQMVSFFPQAPYVLGAVFGLSCFFYSINKTSEYL